MMTSASRTASLAASSARATTNVVAVLAASGSSLADAANVSAAAATLSTHRTLSTEASEAAMERPMAPAPAYSSETAEPGGTASRRDARSASYAPALLCMNEPGT